MSFLVVEYGKDARFVDYIKESQIVSINFVFDFNEDNTALNGVRLTITKTEGALIDFRFEREAKLGENIHHSLLEKIKSRFLKHIEEKLGALGSEKFVSFNEKEMQGVYDEIVKHFLENKNVS